MRGGDARMPLQPFGDGERGRVVPRRAHRQRAQAPHGEPGGERVHHRAEQVGRVPDPLDQRFRADQNPAEEVGVAAQRLGRAVHDEVGAQAERPLVDRGGDRVVDHDDRLAVRLGDGGDARDVGDAEQRIGRTLQHDEPGLGLEHGGEGVDVGLFEEVDRDPEARRDVAQEAGHAGVERRLRYDMPARRQAEHRARGRGHARRERHRGLAALQLRDRVFEQPHRRVAVAGVEARVARLGRHLKELVRVRRPEGRGLVERRRDRPGVALARAEPRGQGVGVEVGHVSRPPS